LEWQNLRRNDSAANGRPVDALQMERAGLALYGPSGRADPNPAAILAAGALWYTGQANNGAARLSAISMAGRF
jgi:hypothetical protein